MSGIIVKVAFRNETGLPAHLYDFTNVKEGI
jgi:hypothetical protein